MSMNFLCRKPDNCEAVNLDTKSFSGGLWDMGDLLRGDMDGFKRRYSFVGFLSAAFQHYSLQSLQRPPCLPGTILMAQFLDIHTIRCERCTIEFTDQLPEGSRRRFHSAMSDRGS